MRVMFVDDEPQVLKGIRRMLDCSEVDWDVETVDGGEKALSVMEEKRVDVIVSDMKMDGMDGAQLLEQVSRLYPDTVRIVLSGQASKESVYRAVAPMHQYLSKPCDAELLRTTIERSCSLRILLDDSKLHKFLGGIDSLPSLPNIYQQVVDEIESENGSVANVGKLVSQDPAMTAKILQLANSAIFGLTATITSPAQAASLLGIDVMRSLVLSLSVFKSFEGSSDDGFCMDSVVAHSFQVGSLALHIAKSEGIARDVANEAFSAGLLHDVGKLILMAYAAEDYARIVQLTKDGWDPLAAEREVFGIGHDLVGGYLLSLWGLPQSLVESVAFHHDPKKYFEKSLSTPSITYLANSLISASSNSANGQSQEEFEEFVAETGFAERVPVWMEQLVENEECV